MIWKVAFYKGEMPLTVHVTRYGQLRPCRRRHLCLIVVRIVRWPYYSCRRAISAGGIFRTKIPDHDCLVAEQHQKTTIETLFAFNEDQSKDSQGIYGQSRRSAASSERTCIYVCLEAPQEDGENVLTRSGQSTSTIATIDGLSS